MKYLYYLYQLLVALPLLVVVTILTTLIVSLGCVLGNGHFWGYFPGKCWAWIITRLFLLPVTVEGRAHLKPGQSYVFVANHQGAFDIFLIYGFLCRNFKWMMKWEIKKIPFVGFACKMSHQIFVDKSGPSRVKETYDQARATLKSGMSLVVFPEGARTYTGKMRSFKKGAFMLADELQLPVVPITINGSFKVMPRTKDWHFAQWSRLRMTIHQPIFPVGQGHDNISTIMRQSYDAVMSDLEEQYKDK